MGSDELFRKRKARKQIELERHTKVRAKSPRYLIVCEGTKTEPHYFNELLDDWRIRPQTVRVAPNRGVSPDRVVEHALQLYNEDALSGDSFDRVYCVFDRDNHTTFDAAVQRTKDLSAAKPSKPFEAITSTPCFEFWFLLHFGYATQPFQKAGKKSVGDQAVIFLKTKPGFQDYGKGKKGIYQSLKEKLPAAILNAQRLRANSAANGSFNPATNVDLLINILQGLV